MGGAADKILTGKTIAGKFRLGERLSGDPAGSIYLAVDVATSQNVMVLALSEGVRLDAEQVARALNHPNILAHRQSYFPNAAQRFVTTDAPNGKSLARIIAKRGKLHPGPAANAALQILSALHAIHSENSFHGNVNPHNVFVNKTEKGELEVRLLYPGAVRVDAPTEAARYFAPEQILGEGDVDRRADIWAVGALLYLCLFGRPPFDGADQEEISGKILLKDPIFPKEAEKLPAELVGAIREALAKEPDKRPQFANNMIGDLLATTEQFDEQMSALVAAALRASIPPAAIPRPTAAKPPAQAKSTVIAYAVPRPAPTPAVEKQPAPRPAPTPATEKHSAPRPAPVPPSTILAAGARPVQIPAAATAAAAPTPDEARAAEALEISTALESALEIDLLQSVPPAPIPGGQRERFPFLKGKRGWAIAAGLAALAALIVVIALATGGEAARPPAPKDAPVAPPRAAANEVPTRAEPPKPTPPEAPAPEPVEAKPEAAPSAVAEKGAAPEPPEDTPAAAPDESPAPAAGKRPGGPAQRPAGKKPKPSQEKKPKPSEGAVGLASNPFGG